jgi:uncharacterized protein YegL
MTYVQSFDSLLTDFFQSMDVPMTGVQNEATSAQDPLVFRNAISIRIITPAIAKLMTKDSKALPAPAFNLPATAKIQQLHDHAVRHLSNNPPDWLNVSSLLDLHIHELPIAPSCSNLTLKETGLVSRLKDDVLTVYAVPRPATTTRAPEPTDRIGMNDLYAAGPHWQPSILQSDRGVAIFLSSLRVFTQLLKSNSIFDEHRDRVVYVFDLLCSFPPAVRALHLLIQGRTISRLASAALSQAFCCVLEYLGHKKLIKNDNTRLFEGARLILGLIMDKANQLKPTNFLVPSYSSQVYQVQFRSSAQAAFIDLMPWDGASTRFDSSTYVQPDADSGELNLLLLSESDQFAVIFNPPDDLFARTQVLQEVFSPDDLHDLHQLANLCGKVSLSVIRPSLLSSVAPEHLTFDSKGHVAVYTGKAGCAPPGRDTVIFRPMHGEYTPNIGQLEQLLAPFLQTYEQDDTNVFDVLGSAHTRALAEPDEIVVFAVDCSASMSSHTDLIGIKNDAPIIREFDDHQISPYVYTQVKLEETKKSLSEHEAYGDILGSVVDSINSERFNVAGKMLTVLFHILIDALSEIDRERIYDPYQRQQNNIEIERLELFAAGIKHFEQELIDMIILGAMSTPEKKWTWELSQDIPGRTQMRPLPHDVTLIPTTLKCPIKLDLIQDPVVAADGQVYSRQAMARWMSIRRTSPLTGLKLEDTELTPDLELAEQADRWLQAEDLVEPEERPLNKRRRIELHHNTIKFSSPSHQFSRALSPDTTLLDLYKVAFRGMRGRHNCFQLCFNEVFEPSSSTISSLGIAGGSIITIIVPDDVDTMPDGISPLCLIKVYSNSSQHVPEFSFWVPKDSDLSFSSLTIKWWRFAFARHPRLDYEKYEIRTDYKTHGDNRYYGTTVGPDELLGDYLTTYFAFGKLGAEPVYRVESNDSDDDESLDSYENPERSEPLVLKIKFSKVASHAKRKGALSRLQVLKQIFESLINRVLAYSYKTHIGLVTFDSTAKVSQSITHVIENFRRSVESMRATGDTALWDGLALAQAEIMKHAEKYPEAQRRIICLSDGNDTKSVAGPADLCWQLRENKIVCDSICIGNDDNMDLKALSVMLKSYSFYPRTLTTALAICEMEPVLSQAERAPLEMATADLPRTSALESFYTIRNSAEFTVVTQDVFPKRKEHPRLGDTFIQLANCVRSGVGTQSSLPTLRSSRLLVEMREIAANPHPMYDCYVSESDMFFWKVVIQGVSLLIM